MNKTNQASPDEDYELVCRSSQGDPKAFEKLYRKYIPDIIRYMACNNGWIQSYEDLAQTVFLRFWKQKDQFRGQSTVKTFLLGIAKNVLRENHYQYQMARKTPLVVREKAEVDEIEQCEISGIIEQAVSQLSEKQQQALDIVLHSSLPLDKAAEILNCPANVFRQRLYDARKRLRMLLEVKLKDFF